MTKDYDTVRVEKAAKSVADDAKADDETWSDYIRRCADAEPSVQRLVDADAVADELVDQLGSELSAAIWEHLDADALAEQTAAYVDADASNDAGGSVSLDASERRAIAEEVAEVLR